MRRRDAAVESPVLAQDELLRLGEGIVLPPLGRGREARAIGLVGRKAFDVIDAVGKRCRAFMGSEISHEIGPRPRYRFAPAAGIGLERLSFGRVDLIAMMQVSMGSPFVLVSAPSRLSCR